MAELVTTSAGAADGAGELLLDPDRLSALLRTPVRATRLRPKSGVSHTAALVAPDGSTLGWAQVLLGSSRVKGAKARERAERSGLGHLVATMPLPQWDADLLWGSVATDPALVRRLTRARVDLAAEGAVLLRYNPLRRVVLRLDGRDGRRYVARVTATAHHDRLVPTVQTLAAAGAPVVAPVDAAEAGLRATAHLTVWPWVEGHDLSASATPEELAGAVRALEALQAVPVTALPALPTRGWAELRRVADRAVHQVAGLGLDLVADAVEALAALPSELASTDPVVLHGDFSLDQCLAGADGKVWLTDLDRAAVGPAEVDRAGVRAAQLLDGIQRAEGAAADGGEAGESVDVSGFGEVADAWVALCLLGRLAEPWRAQQPGWQEQTVAIGRLALELAAGGSRSARPGRADRPATPPGIKPAWRVPAIVPDGLGGDLVVERAWPDRARQGVPRVSIEGRDSAGHLRAGTVGRDGSLDLLPHGEDPRLPGLALATRTGSLLVHRAGRRAVVHTEDGYLKLLRAGRGPGIATTSLIGSALCGQVGLQTAAVLEVRPDAVRFAALPGTPVQRLADDPAWPRVWAAWARGWTALQTVADPALARHTPQDEAEVLRTWRSRAATVDLLAGTAWDARLRETAAALASSEEIRLVPAHRDLHDGQLLWDGRAIAVLDLDTASLAEPALDLANLAVHAELRRAQGVWSAAAARVVQDAVAQVSLAGEVTPDRMLLAERATVARLVAVYAFRPTWRDVVLDWAEGAWARLEERDGAVVRG